MAENQTSTIKGEKIGSKKKRILIPPEDFYDFDRTEPQGFKTWEWCVIFFFIILIIYTISELVKYSK